MKPGIAFNSIKNAALGIIVEILYALFVMGSAFLLGMCAIWWIK